MKIKGIIKSLYNDEDIKFLVKNGKFNLIYEVMVITLGFFTSWCFANFVSIDFYGNYLLIISIISFFSFLNFSGINTSLMQSTARGYDYFLITSIKKIFKYSVTGMIALILFSIYSLFFFKSNMVIFTCLVIGGGFFPFIHGLNSYQFFLEGKKEFKKKFFFKIIILFSTYSILLILIFLTQNLILHFILYYGTQMIFQFFFSKDSIKMIKTKERNKEFEQEGLKYGIFLHKISILSGICLNINNVIIGFYYGPYFLTFYVIGTLLPYRISNLIKSSIAIFFPKFSEHYPKISKKMFFFTIIFSIVIFFLVIIILPIFLLIFYPKYIDSLSYGIVGSLFLIIYPIDLIFSYYFKGKKDLKIIKKSQILPDIFNLIFLIPYLILFGIYGIILMNLSRYLFILIIFILSKNKIEFN